MINYQKSVFNRLFKEESVELSKVDVELNNASELKKVSSEFSKISQDISKYIKQAEQIDAMVKEIKSWEQKVDSLFDQSVDTEMGFRDKSRELGLDPLQNKDYKDLIESKNKFKSERKKLDQIFFKYSK